MTRDRQDESGRRDTTLARLVVAGLESQGAMPDGFGACPDADVLAAYADRELDEDETAHWENHFAGCAHCQKVFAVLTISTEDPLTQQEIMRLGQLVSKSPVAIDSTAPSHVIKTAKSSRRPALWRWLIPSISVAAAAALWLALRPPVPGALMSAQKAVMPPPTQETQMAQANVPPTPAASTPAPDLGRDAQILERRAEPRVEDLAKTRDALRAKAAEPAGSSLQAETNGPVAPMAAARQESDGNGPTSSSGAQNDKSGGAVVVTAPALSRPTEANRSVAVTGAVPHVQKGSGAGQAPLSPPSQAQPAIPSASSASATPPEAREVPPSGRIFATTAKLLAAPVIFSTANGAAEWRLGGAGRIDRSTDQGKTWRPQPSGVTSELLAGVAVTDKIAWIVGRASVVLRTTDGEHWQRLASPPSLPTTAGGDDYVRSSDWGGVESSDALHATIASADGGRRFTTADGGRTWTPQP